jgi:hypothetical protein
VNDDLRLSQAWVDALREAHHYDVPPGLRQRLPRPVPRPLRRVVLLLGVLLVQNGIGNVAIGPWIADQVHGHYDAHSYREAAIATVAVGVLLVLAYFRTSWIRAATTIGVPVGLALGVTGSTEITVTPYGFALHFTEGVVALVLLVMWRRYANGGPPEEQT